MYLKSLEMQGFKSFPDKTKLIFENGTTVIVGPNGSGKSNISDAMRWVLGEISTKSIRSAKMEDIIFGGADGRKPMSFAEVSVTFDNTDKEHRLESPFDEVTVTRRYYRAGESEYLINRRPVRLKDIYELFMNTGIGRDGYSIIGQGKIAEILSRKSDERRSIFEDASGIAKYRFKKNDSERKLAATEDNMNRANDIFTVICEQLGPLEKDAEKARRAIELMEAKKKVDVQLWLFDTDRLHHEVEQAEERFKYSSFDLQNANEALQAYEQQYERLNQASQDNRRISAELLERIQERTKLNFEIDSQFKLNENQISHCRELIASAEGEVVSLRRTLEAEEKDYIGRNARLTELNAKLVQLREQQENCRRESADYEAQAAKLSDAIDRALVDIRNLEKEAIDAKVQLSVIENAQLTNTDKNSSIAVELEKYTEISDELTHSCEQ
ncbi:MAG: AAA family ATPase, partial [Oscillospiraceae bacterium]|nr:AAA family ATPase [Oscillospiraceae bacterium]